MSFFRSAWLLPVSQPPIRDAWVRTEHGRVTAFGRTRRGDFIGTDEIDLGDVVVLPGLINAHTHLELSWLRGRIPETDDFDTWIRRVIDLRHEAEGREQEVERAIVAGIDEARRCGTALVGDVSNTWASSRVLAERAMPAVVFHELIGFRSADAEALMREAVQRLERQPSSDLLRHTLAPHAPYSVSPSLFARIRGALGQDPLARSTIHLGESAQEVEFLLTGTGPCRAALERLGKWDSTWVAPECGPVEYLDRLGFLDERILVVHGVHLRSRELASVRERRATIVTCPRGNRLTGAGTPPIDDFYASGNRVAVGTDSLASVPDLNLFAELAELRRLAPKVPAAALIESATRSGARALGFERQYGSIESGKCDCLIAVKMNASEPNVEEYLLSGITDEQITWLPAA